MKIGKIEIKTSKKTILSLVSLPILLGIIIVINYLSYHIFCRLDLTQGGIYSLSKASKDLVRKLDDRIIIKAYFNKNLPAPYNSNRKYFEDLLAEYKTYSKGKISYEFIDPAGDEKLQQEARSGGIAPVNITQVKNDKYEQEISYMGAMFLYGDKKEILPFVKQTVGLEYDVTSRIKKLTQEVRKKVGFLAGHKEPDPFTDLGGVYKRLSEQYELRTVSVKDGTAVPEDLDALVVLSPEEKISEREKYEVDQFIMKGKPVAFLIDSVNVNLTNFMGNKIEHNLNNLLSNYGVEITPGLVLDRQCQRISVQQRQGFFTIQNIIEYPLLPVATVFRKENPIVRELEKVSLPFASPLILKDVPDGKIKPEWLIKSSENSWQKDDVYFLSPLQNFPTQNLTKKGPYILAATVTGKFKSFYSDKEVPAVESADKTKKDKKDEKKSETIKESPDNRIIIVGNGRIMRGDFLKDPMSGTFFFNIVDWLAQDTGLISIRSKGIEYRPLKETSKETRNIIKWLNVLLVPAGFIVYGIIRWRIRKIKRKGLTLNEY